MLTKTRLLKTPSAGGSEAALTAYLCVRQYPRKFVNPRLGNFCVADVHPFECGETVKVFQTCVRNLNAVKIQNLDFRQPLEMSDARVGYCCA